MLYKELMNTYEWMLEQCERDIIIIDNSKCKTYSKMFKFILEKIYKDKEKLNTIPKGLYDNKFNLTLRSLKKEYYVLKDIIDLSFGDCKSLYLWYDYVLKELKEYTSLSVA